MSIPKIRLLILYLMVFFLQVQHTNAQSKSSEIIGNWTISKWEYLNKDPNRNIQFEKDAKDKIVTFKEDNKCETTKTVNGKKQIISSGSYNISEDGKYFIQDKQRYEIVSFEKDEFAVKVESDLILHFKRVVDSK
jgi:hypothetical protein